MITRRMRIACWTPKATNTHSQYVILIAFPLQQWLQERFSLLRYTHFARIFLLCYLKCKYQFTLQYILPVLYRCESLSADGQNTDGMCDVWGSYCPGCGRCCRLRCDREQRGAGSSETPINVDWVTRRHVLLSFFRDSGLAFPGQGNNLTPLTSDIL